MESDQLFILVMISKAVEFLKKKEGFTPVAIWDVNAWRIGYGSDTITNSLNQVRKVIQTDRITQADADRDLSRRISQEFIPKIKAKIGADTWNQLPENTQIAFISLAYNYGNITKASIVATAKTLNLKRLSEVWIESTYNDNKKLPENVRNALRKRRAEEAALIATDAASGSGVQGSSILIPVILLISGVYILTR